MIKSRIVSWAEHVARTGKRKGARRVFVGKSGGKITHGSPRRKWEDNIKMNHQAVGLSTWTGLIWLRTGTIGGFL